MKCAVCHKEWKRLDVYCPGCGAPVTARRRSMVMEVLLVAAALGLLLWLLKLR
jgi:predicted amidophosphoribosyltransferase